MMTKLKKLLCIILAVMTASSVPLNAQCAECVTSAACIKAAADGDFKYKSVADDGEETVVEITSYSGRDKSVVIPSELDGCRVVGVSAAFGKCGVSFKQITLSEGIKYVGNSVFSYLNDVEITLPSSLEYIGENAFEGSTLASLSLPEGLLGIGKNAFFCTELADGQLILPDSLLYLGSSVNVYEKEQNRFDMTSPFNECSITSLYISDNAKFVKNLTYSYTVKFSYDEIDGAEYASPFNEYDCIENIDVSTKNPYLKSDGNILYTGDYECLLYCPKGYRPLVSINESTKYIAPYAFSYCDIGTLNIGRSVKYLPFYTAREAQICEITFDDGCALSSIGDYAFDGTQLSGELVIPNNVKYIGAEAFADTDITSLSFELPSGCKTISLKAFYNCNSLENIFIPNSVTEIGCSMPLGTDGTNEYTVFKSSSVKSIVFEDNSQLRYIPYGAFKCTKAETLDFGEDSSLEFCYCSFQGLTNLNLTGCGKLLFAKDFSYGKFTSVDLSSTRLRSVSGGCFRSCTSLTDVTLSDETHMLFENAFGGCTSLSDIDLTNIGYFESSTFSGTKVPYGKYDRSLKEYGGFKYYEYDGSVGIWSYTTGQSEKADSLIIPDTIDGMPVVAVEDGAFAGCEAKSVTIPDTVTYIGSNAFKDCKLEEAPIIPDGVTYIGGYAFYGNFENGADIIIPDSVKYIGPYCFSGDMINSIDLGSVEEIGYYAFGGCTNIDEITVPASVAQIGKNAFYNSGVKRICFEGGYDVKQAITCYKGTYDADGSEQWEYLSTLEQIETGSENPGYKTLDGVLYNGDMTEIICYPAAKTDESYIMPSTVTEIPDGCFENNIYLKNITLSEKLEIIGGNAFFGSVITQIILPSSVVSIGVSAFESCAALEKVTFEDGITIPLLDRTFCGCTALKSVDFGGGVSIDRITNYAFSQTALTSLTLPDNVSVITNYAFSNKNSDTLLTEIKLPEKLTRLDNNAFYRSGIVRIEIPESLEYIGVCAFRNCRSLCEVILNNTKGIDSRAFANCTALESIDLTGVTAVSKTAFSGCKNLTKLYFTKDAEDAYIAENEFQGNETVETVVVGNGVTEIRDYAFADCAKLETALIADSVTSISDTAFDGCENLTIVCMSSSYAASYSSKNNISCTTFIVDPIPDQEYTGKAITPKLTVRMGTGTLKADEDYRATYSDNINVGTAKATVIGLGDYSIFGTVSRFNIIKTKADTPSEPATQKPSQSGSDSTGGSGSSSGSTGGSSSGSSSGTNTGTGVSSSGNAGNAGTSSGTSQSTGLSSGTSAQKTTTAAAKPAGAKKVNGEWVNTGYKKPSVKKLTKGKKQFKVTWKKASGVSGYQVQYSTDSKFRKNKKTVTISGAKNTSKTVKALKSKKKYYVRIRTYKNVKVNGKTVRVYSSWSKAKSVKTK